MQNILVTGATGQIGSALTIALRQQYGASHVVAAGHRRPPDRELLESGPYCSVNIRDAQALQQVVRMALMEADGASLTHRNAYNVTAMSVAPQAIADSWPRHLDDSAARTEWGWGPRYDLAAMTRDMLDKLTVKFTTATGD